MMEAGLDKLNNIFDHVFLINLPESKERLEHCLKHLHGLSYERINAIKGMGYSSEINGKIGCRLSHLECLNLAHERGYENILVLEDDVLFAQDISCLDNVKSFLVKEDWALFYLGGQHAKRSIRMITKNIVAIDCTFDTHAIAYNLSYYNQILEAINIKESFAWADGEEVDCKLIMCIQKKLPCYSIYPRIAFQSKDFDSIITPAFDKMFDRFSNRIDNSWDVFCEKSDYYAMRGRDPSLPWRSNLTKNEKVR